MTRTEIKNSNKNADHLGCLLGQCFKQEVSNRYGQEGCILTFNRTTDFSYLFSLMIYLLCKE